MKLFYLLISLYLFSLTAKSQVNLDKPIIFISNQDEEKRVSNIVSTSNNDLIEAKEVIFNSKIYATTLLNGDTLYANFNDIIDSLYLGFSFYLKIPTTSANAFTFLSINGFTPKIINLYKEQQLLDNNIKQNEVIKVIYDGNQFQILKRKKKDCPVGFKEVNSSYCITEERSGTGNFHANVMYCDSLNARLCRWSEWYYACQSPNLGLTTNMSQSGFEWVDTGAVIEKGAKIVGHTSCTYHSVGHSITSESIFFRCCYTR